MPDAGDANADPRISKNSTLTGYIKDCQVGDHGTVRHDSLILQAAYNVLEKFKSILYRKDMMIVSVAYPEENLDTRTT